MLGGTFNSAGQTVGQISECFEHSFCCKLIGATEFNLYNNLCNLELTYMIPQKDMMHPLLEMVFCGNCISGGRVRGLLGSLE